MIQRFIFSVTNLNSFLFVKKCEHYTTYIIKLELPVTTGLQ